MWNHVVELTAEHKPNTHKCSECGTKLTVFTNRQGRFILTSLRRHFKSKHPRIYDKCGDTAKVKTAKIEALFERQHERVAERTGTSIREEARSGRSW